VTVLPSDPEVRCSESRGKVGVGGKSSLIVLVEDSSWVDVLTETIMGKERVLRSLGEGTLQA
jgi:hypothetical protein